MKQKLPIILKNNDSLITALKTLNGLFGRVAYIVDKNEKLIGLVTEGDIRRSLISGFSIEESLEAIANVSPLTLNIDEYNKIQNNNINEKLTKKINQILKQNFEIPVIQNNIIFKSLEVSYFKNIISKSFENNSHIKVLIIGGMGYIGSRLTNLLLNKNFSVKVVDNLLYNQNFLSTFEEDQNFEFIQGDICDLNTQLEAVKDVDAVVYLSEIVGDPACKSFPEKSLKTNYLALCALSTLCAHLKISRFIYTSSCSVYGSTTDPSLTLTESSQVNPLSHYARMKLESENFLLNIKNNFFHPTILRLGTVFGYSYRQRFDLVVNKFVKDSFLFNRINIQGGKQFRPNIHVDDISEAIVSILDLPLDKINNSIFNLSNGSENKNIIELAEEISSVIKNTKIVIDNKISDNRNYRVSSKKIHDTLGINANTSIKDGVIDLYNKLKNNKFSDIDSPKYSNIEFLLN